MISYSATADIIYRVSRQLNTSLDLNEVLGKVLKLTVEATGALQGSLFLLDNGGNLTRQIISYSKNSYKISPQNVKLALSHGLAGWVYRHQHGALAADITTDERWTQFDGGQNEEGSALVVPLLYQDRVNGILSLRHEGKRYFDESHLALAAGIAGQAAVAVENARLFTQIKNEREGLYMLINALPTPMLEVTKDKVMFANKAARQSLLLQEVKVPLSQIEGGKEIQTALDEMHRQAKTHIEAFWPDGRVFNISINDVPRLGTIIELDDITYLKEMDKMKSQFVETVSHDLKNPLATIMGFANILEQEEQLSETGQLCLDKIKLSAQQMRTLIEDLLDLAHIEAGFSNHIEAHNISQIAKDILDNFELQFQEKKLILKADLPKDIPLILINRLHLSQTIINLISNAIKYTPLNGKIHVSVNVDGSEVWFRVSDTGPGISPAGQSQLFQKFYRVPEIVLADQSIDGTGLGLSIVKAVVEGYGGRVFVESEVGLGSTFGFVLPVAG